MVIRKSVRKLEEFVDDSIPRIEALEVTDDLALVRDLAVARFRSLSEQIENQIAAMRQESVEAQQAGDRRDQLEGQAVDAYDLIYKGLRIANLKAQVSGRLAGGDHMDDLNRFLEGNNPTDFAEATVPAKLGYLERAFQFRTQFLDDTLEPEVIDAAHKTLEELREANDVWNKETQEAREEAAGLDRVEKQARLEYRAGREWIRGVLVALDRADEIGSIIPALREIWNTSQTDDAEEPTPEPTPA